MSDTTFFSLISILLALLAVQLFALIIIKGLLKKIGVMIQEIKNSQKKISYQTLTREIISENSYKTCENCIFRQSFIDELSNENESFFYRCKIRGTDIQLKDSCTRFQLESSTSNSK